MENDKTTKPPGIIRQIFTDGDGKISYIRVVGPYLLGMAGWMIFKHSDLIAESPNYAWVFVMVLAAATMPKILQKIVEIWGGLKK